MSKNALIFFMIIFAINLTINSVIGDSQVKKSHHFTMGYMQEGDYLLYRGIIVMKAKFLRKRTMDIKFPEIAGIPLGPTITYIKATDQYQNGQGGYVSLYEGGVGQKTVTMHLKSQRGHGFNFLIEIYGGNSLE